MEEDVDEAVDGGSGLCSALVATGDTIMAVVLVFCHQLPISILELPTEDFVEVDGFVEGTAGFVEGTAGFVEGDVMGFPMALDVVVDVADDVMGLVEVEDGADVAEGEAGFMVVTAGFSALAGLVGVTVVTVALV